VLSRAALVSCQVFYLLAPMAIGMVLLGLALRYDVWPAIRRPIDGGLMFRGRPLFGANKTWLALLCSLSGCILGVTLQAVIGGQAGPVAIVHYDAAMVLPFAATLCLGATVGELINSFVKRQCGLPPGQVGRGPVATVVSAIDQIDFLFILWPLLFLLWLRPSWSVVTLSFILVFIVHQFMTLVGHRLGFRPPHDAGCCNRKTGPRRRLRGH
jgi:hypothetical protein